MAKTTTAYPFLPKSTVHLRPGMIWEVRLRDGSYGCGRVLQLEGKRRVQRSRSTFFGGLLRWHGPTVPTIESIAGAPVLWQGEFEVRSIGATGSLIRGCLPPEADGLMILPMLTSILNGQVMVGYDLIRKATDEEFRTLPVKSLGVDNESFRKIAEEVFLDGKPPHWERQLQDDNALRDHLNMKTPDDLKRVEEEASKAWRKQPGVRTGRSK